MRPWGILRGSRAQVHPVPSNPDQFVQGQSNGEHRVLRDAAVWRQPQGYLWEHQSGCWEAGNSQPFQGVHLQWLVLSQYFQDRVGDLQLLLQ